MSELKQRTRCVLSTGATLTLLLSSAACSRPTNSANVATGTNRTAVTTTTANTTAATPSAPASLPLPSPTQSTNGGASVNPSPIAPDPRLTPGDVLDVTKDDICTPGYAKKVRDVPQAVKEQAYRQYGITSRQPREYEVDHLISLELGGSNSLKNLWPESFITEPWNAHVKDKLENKLHDLICTGQLDIKTAQHEIASDWVAAYKKYLGAPGGKQTATTPAFSQSTPPRVNTPTTNQPVAKQPNGATAPGTTATNGATNGAVIGNRKSHIYHRANCPDYGKVSAANRVEFASAAEAEQAGYRLAGNCPR